MTVLENKAEQPTFEEIEREWYEKVYCISMFVGAALATLIVKVRPKEGEMYVVPVASGLIAGESLMAILVNILQSVVGLPSK